MATKTRELSWSLSRARMFEECPRRFYYQYYFSKFGYMADAPDDARLALEMARIKGMDMWVGEVVHQTIQWVLEQTRAGVIPTLDEAKSNARQRLSDGWRGSVKQLWRVDDGDLYPNLFEHYYGANIDGATTDRLKSKTFTSVTNFMDSDIFKSIAVTPADRWLPIEKYASFRLDGLLLYVKFDFAVKDGTHITVYDWKTGKPTENENLQLACYALYASSMWNAPLDDIKVCAAHLQPTFEADEKLVDESEIDDMRAFIHRSFDAMVKCLRNPARNIAAMDDFPMTGNLLRCMRCQFKGICVQGKQASGDVDNLPVVDDWDG